MIKHLKLTIHSSEVKNDSRTFLNCFNDNQAYDVELTRVSSALSKLKLDWWSVIGYKYRCGLMAPAHFNGDVPLQGSLTDGYEILVSIDTEIDGNVVPEVKSKFKKASFCTK